MAKSKKRYKWYKVQLGYLESAEESMQECLDCGHIAELLDIGYELSRIFNLMSPDHSYISKRGCEELREDAYKELKRLENEMKKKGWL